MSREMKFNLKCDRCGDVIGTYEPVIVVNNGGARRTSLAAEPGLASRPGEHYHRPCYEDLARA